MLLSMGAPPSTGRRVVWTVAFNTSTSGYSPQGAQTPPCTLPAATATQPPVCPQNPADSLNVGDKTYPAPAPYAGTSLFVVDANAPFFVELSCPSIERLLREHARHRRGCRHRGAGLQEFASLQIHA